MVVAGPPPCDRGRSSTRAWARGFVHHNGHKRYVLSPTPLEPDEYRSEVGRDGLMVEFEGPLRHRHRYSLAGEWNGNTLKVDAVELCADQVPTFVGPPWEQGLTTEQAERLRCLMSEIERQEWMTEVHSISVGLVGTPPSPNVFLHLRFPSASAKQWVEKEADVRLACYLDTSPLPSA